MKKKLAVILFFLMYAIVSATPYYPSGIPSIGPLKGQVTFWGEDADGNYFDGVSYGTDYEINIPNHGQLKIRVMLSTYSDSKEATKNVALILAKPIEGFSGEINIKAVNSNKESIIRNYKGDFNGVSDYNYNNFFDFSGIDEKSRVTLELILENGKKTSVRLNNSMVKDLIFISQFFPEEK